ncbi:MAG: efflux RND transporter permease subunit [Deltaproteobacteria bacterium]|nr:efflux RND transporter permease subunit [Deltaproteobacteria bacterium]
MWISEVSIRRPVFTVMVISALMVLGLISMCGKLQLDLFPDVAFPVVIITTPYPGASPEEVETLVTKPIEEAVSGVSGLKRIQSWSRESVSTVLAEFRLETDIKLAAVDVREKVETVRHLLPEDVEDPLTERFDPADTPVLVYSIAANRNPYEIRRATEDLIKPAIEGVDGVGQVDIIGGLEREIQINLDLHALQAHRIPIERVVGLMRSENMNVPGGHVTSGQRELTIRTLGEFRNLEEIADLVVSDEGGTQVRIRDIGTVVDGYKEVRKSARTNGLPAVAVEIRKQSGSNTVEVAENVFHAVDKLREVLPPDYRLITIIDSAERVNLQVDEVGLSIFYGALMAVFVIFIFMLDWRSTVISALALPTSVISTFFFMWLMGFSINIMTLMALSLAIGMLIDDAVVVRENIFRHMEEGDDPVTAARVGTAEIGLAVMATTFTIVAVFLPVGFMSGIVGKFFQEFGLTVVAAVMISLFVSFTLDPMLSANVMKPVAPDYRQQIETHPILGYFVRFWDRTYARYETVLRWALDHRKTVLGAALGMFVISIFVAGLMGSEFVAKEDRSEFNIALEMPVGTSYKAMDEVVKRVEQVLSEHPDYVRMYTVVGRSAALGAVSEDVNQATIRALFTPKLERNKSIWEIQDDIRARIKNIAGLKFVLAEIPWAEGAGEYPVNLYIRGNDLKTLTGLSRSAYRLTRDTPGAVDVDTSLEFGKPEVAVVLDRKRAANAGVGVGGMARSLRTAVEGEVASLYRDGRDEYDIRVRLKETDREAPSLLENMLVSTARGSLVLLKEVADLQERTGPGQIERENRQRQVTITANSPNRALGDVIKDLQTGMKAMDIPPGYAWGFSGEAQRMEESFQALLAALGLAILFIYMVLAAQFDSFLHPFTIMLALPLAVIGAFLALFLTGKHLGMSPMIGIVMLMGLVTKNGILLVDHAIVQRQNGLGAREAMLKAGPIRLRAIVMTSLAMIFGMIPTAVGQAANAEFRSPMAIAIIGGLITSTLLTLVVIPVVFTYVDRFSFRRRVHAPARKPVAADAGPAPAGRTPEVAPGLSSRTRLGSD